MPTSVEAALAQLWRVDNRADLFILADSPDTGGLHPAPPEPNSRRP